MKAILIKKHLMSSYLSYHLYMPIYGLSFIEMVASVKYLQKIDRRIYIRFQVSIDTIIYSFIDPLPEPL